MEASAGGAAGVGGERFAEPRVLAGAVVGDDVEQQLESEAAGVGHQQVELGQVTVDRVDVAVVGDVVTVVVLRRRIERAEPDAVDTELPEVRQSGPYAGQVTDAVPRAVEEAAYVHLVDHRIAPPGGGRAGGVAEDGRKSCEHLAFDPFLKDARAPQSGCAVIHAC